ncbi:chaperone protein DnaJ isoform X3 [Juglans microcarpa x Juglans regia]|uniref:chaperone protein DnaJ isoform X3 n=1 Tax=Juglans microcarpa x Juglans regia TaxID=2249226 RepID=UPI001B7E6E87|nr:chaperone protein DnaJ isoform X3 [Juglans microcarpa x Juglans regia]
MRGDEARTLLGFPPNYRPTLPQVKAAYRRKVWESHPDLFPAQEKPHAEYKFKLISEAYSCLLSEPEDGKEFLYQCRFLDFVSAKADFGLDLAIDTRAEFDPALEYTIYEGSLIS